MLLSYNQMVTALETHLGSITAILTQAPCSPYVCQGADLCVLCVYEGTVELRSQTVCFFVFWRYS